MRAEFSVDVYEMKSYNCCLNIRSGLGYTASKTLDKGSNDCYIKSKMYNQIQPYPDYIKLEGECKSKDGSGQSIGSTTNLISPSFDGLNEE